MAIVKNLTGQRFNRVTVLGLVKINNESRWHCICDCGTEFVVRGGALVNGNTKSCGCYAKERVKARFKKNDLPSSFNLLVSRYRHKAKQRGYCFLLTHEQCLALVQASCHYCGVEPQREIKGATCDNSFIYNGIDRVNNSIGYTYENCVPCCTTCNQAKSSLTEEQFLAWVMRVCTFKGLHV